MQALAIGAGFILLVAGVADVFMRTLRLGKTGWVWSDAIGPLLFLSGFLVTLAAGQM